MVLSLPLCHFDAIKGHGGARAYLGNTFHKSDTHRSIAVHPAHTHIHT